MELTTQQKVEIKEYIIDVPRYRETFNELYDHILNSLKENPGTYSIEEVARIINNDFGGFSEIVNQEVLYQKQINKKYNKFFIAEMLNTFRWSGIINNLILIALFGVFYYSNKSIPFNTKAIILGVIISCALVAAFGYSKIVLNKFKSTKYSILDNYLGFASTFGIIIINCFMQLFIGKANFLSLNEDSKLIAILILCLFSSIYIRGFMKFYTQKFKILTA